VSHPIPLHTAKRLERALEASSRFVAARGPKWWVMRIVAFFACQYAAAVIELLEGLLAEYRAGTLILPEMVDDSWTDPDQREPAEPRLASGSRRAASRRTDVPRDMPSDMPADVPEQSGRRTRPLEFTLSPPCLLVNRPEQDPRGIADYPSAVPRAYAGKIGCSGITPTHVHFVAISKHFSAACAVTHHLAFETRHSVTRPPAAAA
jgi:hypothetical protein